MADYARSILTCFVASWLALNLAQHVVAAPQKSAPSEKIVVVPFPADVSYGRVSKIFRICDLSGKNLLQTGLPQAKGKLELPVKDQLDHYMFLPNYNAIKHLEIFDRIPPDAFSMIRLDRLEVDDSVMPKLAKMSGLKRLDIIDTDITDKGLEELKSLKDLEDLQLMEGSFTGSFLKGLPPMRKFVMLRFTSCPVETKYLDQYSATLPLLKRIRLIATNLRDRDLAFLRKYPTLLELRLSTNPGITDGAIIYLRQCSQIDFLDLMGTSVTPSGVKQLAEAGIKIKTLLLPTTYSATTLAMLKPLMKSTVISTDPNLQPEPYQALGKAFRSVD